MAENRLTIYTHDDCLRHDMGAGVAECPARLQRLFDMFASDLPDVPVLRPDRRADMDTLSLGHDPAYIARLQKLDAAGVFPVTLDNDTRLGAGSLHAAFRAVGVTCAAVDDLNNGACDAAFVAVRPPGHHALYDAAMGFCLFNNAFIAARYSGAQRPLIVDFDVHHGNGTDALVRRFPDTHIYYASTHMAGYPHTGQGTPSPHICNIQMDAGATSAQYRARVEEILLPFVESVKTDFLVFAAGFDAHADDPLGNMRLNEDDFEWMTTRVMRAAGRVPTLSVLEGGYNLDALENSCLAHIQAMAYSIRR